MRVSFLAASGGMELTALYRPTTRWLSRPWSRAQFHIFTSKSLSPPAPTYIALGLEGTEVQAAAVATREELTRAGVCGAHSNA